LLHGGERAPAVKAGAAVSKDGILVLYPGRGEAFCRIEFVEGGCTDLPPLTGHYPGSQGV
jgi:hypothetical protein